MFIHFKYFFLLFFSLVLSVQSQSEITENYIFFDAIIGIENTDLHYGKVYQEKHRVKTKKTKFFPAADFVLGSVVFDGQPYFNIPIKYNVFDDELLMQIEVSFGGTILQLHKEQLNSFRIGNHSFIKIESDALKNGFYEVILENNSFSLFKKHLKSLRQILDSKLVFYEFEEEEPTYFLNYKNTYYSIEKTADLITIFSKNGIELKSFEEQQDSSLPFGDRLNGLLVYINTMLYNQPAKIKGN